ncbi:unnamed protein product, partial [Mesorhabditis spiculigera]
MTFSEIISTKNTGTRRSVAQPPMAPKTKNPLIYDGAGLKRKTSRKNVSIDSADEVHMSTDQSEDEKPIVQSAQKKRSRPEPEESDLSDGEVIIVRTPKKKASKNQSRPETVETDDSDTTEMITKERARKNKKARSHVETVESDSDVEVSSKDKARKKSNKRYVCIEESESDDSDRAVVVKNRARGQSSSKHPTDAKKPAIVAKRAKREIDQDDRSEKISVEDAVEKTPNPVFTKKSRNEGVVVGQAPTDLQLDEEVLEKKTKTMDSYAAAYKPVAPDDPYAVLVPRYMPRPQKCITVLLCNDYQLGNFGATMRVLVLLINLAGWALADIFSCGGYIQSPEPIDFSKIKIQLYTTDNHLKQEEEVNAQNGYYMLPVYQKGTYSLRVSTKEGYHFAPSAFELVLNGVDDPCTKNQDINFKIQGFEITGSVQSQNGQGPTGLAMALIKDNQQVAKTLTKEGGKYTFVALPGEYEVSTASESSVCVAKGRAKITVKNAPVQLSEPLKVYGYPIQVNLEQSGRAMKDVTIELHTAEKLELPGCKPVDKAPKGLATKFVCPIRATDSEGKTMVDCAPPGTHYIVAKYETPTTKIYFEPEALKLDVVDQKLSVTIKAVGLSAKGRVLRGSQGLSKIEIHANDKLIGSSDSEGYFALEKIPEGRLKLTAKADHSTFSVVNADVTFGNPKIPDIQLIGYDLCGTVKSGDGKSEQILVKGKSVEEVITPKSDGKFCKTLPPGEYIVKPKSQESGLTPREVSIDLTNGPRLDLTFSHFKTNAKVAFECLGPCEENTVQLIYGSTLIQTAHGKDVAVFTDIAPGTYDVKVVANGKICWSSTLLQLQVDFAEPAPIKFEQQGFRTNVKLSHPTPLKWVHTTRKDLHGEHAGVSGPNEFCVPLQGTYRISLYSCRTYDRPTFEIEVPSDQVYEARAIDASVKGNVAGSGSADIKIRVEAPSGHQDVKVVNGVFSFRLPIAQKGDVLLVPQSPTHLFQPTSGSFRFNGECLENVANFKANKGIYVEGKITPAVEGVEIVGQHTKDRAVKFQAKTDKSGAYRIGPVISEDELDITAQLDGYILTAVSGKHGHFTSLRLSRLSVVVTELGQPDSRLEGVLLSVVGSDYRSNNMIDKTGELSFVGLAPGDYYVRPILQEFKFEPSQITVKVAEGEHVNIELKGKRVEWSCFGQVLDMNGRPATDAVVQAVAADCDQHQADATVELEGSYRIRGLKPQCEYKITLKTTPNWGTVEHSFPESYVVKMKEEHIHNIKFSEGPLPVGYEIIGEFDTSGLPTPPKTVKMSLLHNQEVVHKSVLYDMVWAMSNLTYSSASTFAIRVEAEQPPRLFTTKEFSFQAEGSLKVVKMQLSDAKKSSETLSIPYSQILAIPFFAVLLLAILNPEKVLELLKRVRQSSASPSVQTKKRL